MFLLPCPPPTRWHGRFQYTRSYIVVEICAQLSYRPIPCCCVFMGSDSEQGVMLFHTYNKKFCTLEKRSNERKRSRKIIFLKSLIKMCAITFLKTCHFMYKQNFFFYITTMPNIWAYASSSYRIAFSTTN